MINWQAFTEPEVWQAIGRIAMNIGKVIGSLAYLYMLAMAIWHGMSIGDEGSSFHFHIKPLKRFF